MDKRVWEIRNLVRASQGVSKLYAGKVIINGPSPGLVFLSHKGRHSYREPINCARTNLHRHEVDQMASRPCSMEPMTASVQTCRASPGPKYYGRSSYPVPSQGLVKEHNEQVQPHGVASDRVTLSAIK